MFSRTTFLALLLSCLTVVAFVVAFGRGNSAKASATVVWEYKVVDKTAAEPYPASPDLERGMNQLGAAGWELVQFIRTEGEARGMWVFKRPK